MSHNPQDNEQMTATELKAKALDFKSGHQMGQMHAALDQQATINASSLRGVKDFFGEQ